MFIKDIFKNKKFVLSIEVFPPKKSDDLDKLFNTVTELKEINPDFVSVTYGAGGSTQEKTVGIASHIKNVIGLETMAHLTCVNSTQADIKNVLDQLKSNNIENILALRGDPPMGQENFTKTIGGFGYASELVEYIKTTGDWSIGVAGYPEGHKDALSFNDDVDKLKLKVDKGADFITTQLFFNNDDFLRYVDIARQKGIKVPIIPGLFPILNVKSIKKTSELSNAKIPASLLSELEKYQDDAAAIEKIGIEYAIKQAEGLIDAGVHGIHFYSMNKSNITKQIYNAIKGKIRR